MGYFLGKFPARWPDMQRTAVDHLAKINLNTIKDYELVRLTADDLINRGITFNQLIAVRARLAEKGLKLKGD